MQRRETLAAERIHVLEAKIAELQAGRSALARLAAECSKTAPGPCPIIASFEMGPKP